MKLKTFKSDEVCQILKEDDDFFQSDYGDDTDEEWDVPVNESVSS